jgi:histidine phosphotransferase ChpT
MTAQTHPWPVAAQLAELVATRLCHDFGSPLSTLTAVMPQAGEAPAHALLTETVAELKARHRLFCVMFGLADDLDWPQFTELLAGSPISHRVAFDVRAAQGIPVPGATIMRLLLAAALVAGEALPRGGVVRISTWAEGGFAILPEGRDASWSPTLLLLISGGTMEAALREGPRRVLAPWVAALAAAEGRRLDFALGAGLGMAPLVISPAG